MDKPEREADQVVNDGSQSRIDLRAKSIPPTSPSVESNQKNAIDDSIRLVSHHHNMCGSEFDVVRSKSQGETRVSPFGSPKVRKGSRGTSKSLKSPRSRGECTSNSGDALCNTVRSISSVSTGKAPGTRASSVSDHFDGRSPLRPISGDSDTVAKRLALQFLGLTASPEASFRRLTTGKNQDSGDTAVLNEDNPHMQAVRVMREALDVAIAQNGSLEAEILSSREQIQTLTDGIKVSMKKTLLYKNKSAAMECQLVQMAERIRELNEENESLRQQRRIHDKTMSPLHYRHAPINLPLGAEITVTNEFKQRMEAILAENATLRENETRICKDMQKLRKENMAMELDSKRADDRLKIERAQRDTLEKVRHRTKVLEKKLEIMARREVKKQQMVKRARTEKLWDRIGRDTNQAYKC